MRKYIIVEAWTTEDIEHQVNSWIIDGFECVGGICILEENDGGYGNRSKGFYQAMIHKNYKNN